MIVWAAALMVLAACGPKAPKMPADAIVLRSPDGQLELKFALVNGVPEYTLDRAGKAVVLPSRLGYALLERESLDGGFTLTDSAFNSFDETWEPVWGEDASIRNHYNELLVTLEQKPEAAREAQRGVSVTDPEYTGDLGNPYGKGAVMQVRFRLYDDVLRRPLLAVELRLGAPAFAHAAAKHPHGHGKLLLRLAGRLGPYVQVQAVLAVGRFRPVAPFGGVAAGVVRGLERRMAEGVADFHALPGDDGLRRLPAVLADGRRGERNAAEHGDAREVGRHALDLPALDRQDGALGFLCKGVYRSKPLVRAVKRQWDATSMVPFLVDDSGKNVLSYDNPESVEAKGKYIMAKGMLGGMFWEYRYDTADHALLIPLVKALYGGKETVL